MKFFTIATLLSSAVAQECTKTSSFTVTSINRPGANGCYIYASDSVVDGNSYPQYVKYSTDGTIQTALIGARKAKLSEYYDYTPYEQYTIGYGYNEDGDDVLCRSKSILPEFFKTIVDINDDGWSECNDGSEIDEDEFVITCGCDGQTSPTPEPVSPTPEPVSSTPVPTQVSTPEPTMAKHDPVPTPDPTMTEYIPENEIPLTYTLGPTSSPTSSPKSSPTIVKAGEEDGVVDSFPRGISGGSVVGISVGTIVLSSIGACLLL